jgi:acyl transferase domain-containing protein
VIKNPGPRTACWISSSVPEAQWNSKLARYSSADYFVNNFVSPVLFQEALSHVPDNAIVIEIAPHSLLQSVLRKELGSRCSIFGLMDKRQPDNVNHLLSTLGKSVFCMSLHSILSQRPLGHCTRGFYDGVVVRDLKTARSSAQLFYHF